MDIRLTPAVASLPSLLRRTSAIAERYTIVDPLTMSEMGRVMQRVTSQLLCVLVSAAAAISCAAARHSEPTPPRVEDAVAVALRYIQTSNGPVTEIVSDPDCTGVGNSTHTPQVACVTTVGDSAIQEFASARDLKLVRKSDPMPLCRWARGDAPGQRGLRMVASRPRESAGSVQIRIELRCRMPVAGFSESGIYELGVVGGTWKVVRTLDRSVT